MLNNIIDKVKLIVFGSIVQKFVIRYYISANRASQIRLLYTSLKSAIACTSLEQVKLVLNGECPITSEYP